jgi:hypothetical protein
MIMLAKAVQATLLQIQIHVTFIEVSQFRKRMAKATGRKINDGTQTEHNQELIGRVWKYRLVSKGVRKRKMLWRQCCDEFGVMGVCFQVLISTSFYYCFIFIFHSMVLQKEVLEILYLVLRKTHLVQCFMAMDYSMSKGIWSRDDHKQVGEECKVVDVTFSNKTSV